MPPDRPHLQAHDEWVLIVAGEARLRIGDNAEHMLMPGDHLLIPGGARHWVTHTATDRETIWLAVHFGD
ncbi:cupin domain-containing protein [Sphingomonas baiyangensis]|uniref:Cupin domain-containing protein n=2 Tax=Sphingomonas baiyangensis TaxID=2572576 RepID=A0A4U1L778_9SPHN|nr:cupin domain-containing protein [Sphingomonas baiyangensis]